MQIAVLRHSLTKHNYKYKFDTKNLIDILNLMRENIHKHKKDEGRYFCFIYSIIHSS